MGTEHLFIAAAYAIILASIGAVLVLIAAARPRALLYLILATLPTQFLFVRVSTFFLSPLDVFVMAAAGAAVIRCAEGRMHVLAAIERHVWVAVMLLAYLLGFVVLGVASRTLLRLLLAVVPSVLACELLRERRHLANAAVALVIGGLIDAGYGLAYYSRGIWLHPTRFSGMSGVNFSAIIILIAAVVGLAQFARTRQRIKLSLPFSLAALSLSTLSKAAGFALLAVWLLVLRKVLTRANRRVIVIPAVVIVLVSLALPPVRSRIVARMGSEVQLDNAERSSTDVRRMILRSVWAEFSDSPLFGVGYSRFQQRSVTDAEIRASTAGVGYGTHNTYLEILVEGGLVAFVPFLLHVAQFLGRFRIVWDRIRRERDLVLAALTSGFLVIVLSAGFANLLLHYSFWAVTGTALACTNVVNRKRLESPDSVGAVTS